MGKLKNNKFRFLSGQRVPDTCEIKEESKSKQSTKYYVLLPVEKLKSLTWLWVGNDDAQAQVKEQVYTDEQFQEQHLVDVNGKTVEWDNSQHLVLTTFPNDDQVIFLLNQISKVPVGPYYYYKFYSAMYPTTEEKENPMLNSSTEISTSKIKFVSNNTNIQYVDYKDNPISGEIIAKGRVIKICRKTYLEYTENDKKIKLPIFTHKNFLENYLVDANRKPVLAANYVSGSYRKLKDHINLTMNQVNHYVTVQDENGQQKEIEVFPSHKAACNKKYQDLHHIAAERVTSQSEKKSQLNLITIQTESKIESLPQISSIYTAQTLFTSAPQISSPQLQNVEKEAIVIDDDSDKDSNEMDKREILFWQTVLHDDSERAAKRQKIDDVDNQIFPQSINGSARS